jgi:hypothetical protein
MSSSSGPGDRSEDSCGRPVSLIVRTLHEGSSGDDAARSRQHRGGAGPFGKGSRTCVWVGRAEGYVPTDRVQGPSGDRGSTPAAIRHDLLLRAPTAWRSSGSAFRTRFGRALPPESAPLEHEDEDEHGRGDDDEADHGGGDDDEDDG